MIFEFGRIQARKKKKAAEKKAEAKCLEEEKKENSSGATAITKDDDPDIQELVKRDPLEELKKYTATLVKNSPNRHMIWIFQYDIAIRRGKAMMALQVRRYFFRKIVVYFFIFSLNYDGRFPQTLELILHI